MRSDGRVWILGAIFMVMAALEIGLAGRQSLWVDEIFSLAIASGHSLEHSAAAADPAMGDFVQVEHPVPAATLQKYLHQESPPASPQRVLRAVLLSDTSPPLYYLGLYLWTLMAGGSDLSLRYFSIIAYLAAFPFFAGIARRTAGENSVIPACLLFAFSPLGLYFSGEGRMYSLLLFLIIVTAWLSLYLQDQPRRFRFYALWVLSSAAGFLTHYFFTLPWIAFVVFLLLHPGHFRRKPLLACLAGVALLSSPWYLTAFSSAGHWRITQGWLTLRPTNYHQTRAIRNQVLQFFSPGGSGLWPFRGWSAWLGLAMFALVAAGMLWRLRWSAFTGNRVVLWFWFILAALAPSIADVIKGTYFANNPRYSLPALPAACLLGGMGIAVLGRRVTPLVLVGIFIAWGNAVIEIYRLDSRSGEPFRRIARSVTREAIPSELIMVHSIPSGVLGIARYCNPETNIASWVQQLGTLTVPGSIEKLAEGRPRVLYILAHPLGEPTSEADWLRSKSNVVRDGWVERIKVTDFRPSAATTF